jgi:GntR family transcriptional regulator
LKQGSRKRKAKSAPAPARPRRLGISTYRRVASVLRRRISSGEWQPGDRLPALDALHRDRRGSSVIAHPLDRRWFTLALNLAELETHSASITVSELEAGPWERPLPVSPQEGRQGEAYHRVVHLHHHSDFPHAVAMTEILIESGVYAELESHAQGNGEAAQDRPILERLAARHADLGHIQQTFTIGEADIELARHLGVHEAAPIAELRRIVRDGGGTIIYFGHLFFRGDLVRLDFSVDLK